MLLPPLLPLCTAAALADVTVPKIRSQGARWFKKAKKLRSDMVGVADEFGRQLFNELDYVKEAYNCIRFKVRRSPLFLLTSVVVVIDVVGWQWWWWHRGYRFFRHHFVLRRHRRHRCRRLRPIRAAAASA